MKLELFLPFSILKVIIPPYFLLKCFLKWNWCYSHLCFYYLWHVRDFHSIWKLRGHFFPIFFSALILQLYMYVRFLEYSHSLWCSAVLPVVIVCFSGANSCYCLYQLPFLLGLLLSIFFNLIFRYSVLDIWFESLLNIFCLNFWMFGVEL